MLAAIRRASSLKKRPWRHLQRFRTTCSHEGKLKAGIGRPLYTYHAAPLVTLGGNIQYPTTGWPRGKRAKVRDGLSRHRYAVFNLDQHFPWAAA